MSDINGVSMKKLTIGRETNEDKSKTYLTVTASIYLSGKKLGDWE